MDNQHAPDQLQRQVERETYGHILQHVEQEVVRQFQLANENLQRKGARPYTFVAPFGKAPIQRTRVLDLV